MECRVRPPASLLLLLVAASFVHAEAALQKPKHIVHWNVTNKMFASFGDVEGDSAALRVDPFDSMEVRCPYYPDGPDSIPPEDREDEYLIVYQVSEFAYMDCLLESKAKMILMCNESKKQLYSTVTFRPFSPLPDGTDYKPGTTYYWITTSSGEKDGIKNSNKGLCMENNMRLRIEVASEDRKEETTTTASEDEEDNDDFRTRDVNPRFRLSPADVAPHPHRMRHNSEKTSRETKESVGRPLADEPSKETEETSHTPKTEEEESYWRKFVKAFDDDQRRYVSELAMSGKEGTYKYIIEDASAPRGPLDPVPIYAQHHKDTNNVNEERSVPSIHGDYLVDESGSPDGASGKTACLVIFFLGFMALL